MNRLFASQAVTLSALFSIASAGTFVNFSSEGPKACPADSPLSCQNTTVVEDLCCFNAPGGQLLLTNFWDADPPTGPEDSWTLHGLWPDRCTCSPAHINSEILLTLPGDGTYEATCDPSRQYSNISDILTAGGAQDTLDYMQTYWKDYQGNDESFWSHEWDKHGTCISTLEPSCYADYKPTEEVVDFFNRAVEIFKTLPSYQWLADAGINPSESETYTSAAIQTALKKQHGNEVTIGCKSGVLNEIWYHYNVKGSVADGEFVSAPPDGTKSTCPASGIKYLPKGSGGSVSDIGSGNRTVTRRGSQAGMLS